MKLYIVKVDNRYLIWIVDGEPRLTDDWYMAMRYPHDKAQEMKELLEQMGHKAELEEIN
jgi:hypothetical protein